MPPETSTAHSGAPSSNPLPAEELPPQAPAWKDTVFRAALIVGSGLLLVGLLTQALQTNPLAVTLLVICSGLGIIMGAFGSMAVVKYKGIVVAGVAAITITLLLLVEHMRRQDTVQLLVEANLKDWNLSLVGGPRVYPSEERSGGSALFVVGREIWGMSKLKLIVAPRSGAESEPDLVFDCLPIRAVANYLGSDRYVTWRFNAARRVLHGVEGLEGEVQSGPCAADDPGFASIEARFITKAYAQSPLETEALLRDLRSDSESMRRDARKALAKAGADGVPAMMSHWAQGPTNYRVKVGVLVALVEMLGTRGTSAQSVSAQLTEPHLELLVRTTDDSDATARYYASEVLTLLADPRTRAAAAKVFPHATERGRHNLAIVMAGIYKSLPEKDKAFAMGDLKSWRPSVSFAAQKKIDEAL